MGLFTFDRDVIDPREIILSYRWLKKILETQMTGNPPRMSSRMVRKSMMNRRTLMRQTIRRSIGKISSTRAPRTVLDGLSVFG